MSTPTATATPKPTSTPTATATPKPTSTPTATPSPIPKVELEWSNTTVRVFGTGAITDEVFEEIVYEVFVNNVGAAFELVIEEGISEIRIHPLSNKKLKTIALLYGVTPEELVYQVFDLMYSITFPQSVKLIEIEGMPTADEITLGVSVKTGSYAEEWATQNGFIVNY